LKGKKIAWTRETVLDMDDCDKYEVPNVQGAFASAKELKRIASTDISTAS